MSTLSTPVTLHLAAALAALVVGPFALTARKGSRLHRAAGWIWVSLMGVAALSAIFIRDYRLPNIAGYTLIHLFVPATLAGLGSAIVAVVRGNLAAHRAAMWGTYLGGCIAAGLFTLLPGRYLGNLLWGDALGWI